MTRAIRTPLFVALLLVAPPLLADAPIAQYEPFDKDDTEIRDVHTKLLWQRDKVANQTKRTYASATASCVGFSGRIPTVKELLTLVDEEPFSTYEFGQTVEKAVDQGAFGNFTAVDAAYWSSTPAGGGQRWGISFKDGTMVPLNENDATGFYVRCVK